MLSSLRSKLRDISLLPPWSRLLPGSSAGFGPPRRWARVADYLRDTGEPSWQVEPAEEIPCPGVQLFGDGLAQFVSGGPVVIPPRTVFRARNLVILGPDSHLVGRRDTFLWDAAWHNTPLDRRAQFSTRSTFKRKFSRPRRKLPGLTAVLGSDWAVGSFGHFVHDALSRWRLVQQAGFRDDDFDQFVLYHPDSDSVRWFIRAAGIPENRVINYDPAVDLVGAEAVGTALGSFPPAHAPATMRWLRQLALNAGAESGERVYLSRAGYRRHPANHEEIESALLQRGFRIVRSDDGMAANRACLSARIVVGVEGTNLAGACFAPPGAKVIILLPTVATFPVYPYMFAACGHSTAVVGTRPGSPVDAPEFPLAQLVPALRWAGA